MKSFIFKKYLTIEDLPRVTRIILDEFFDIFKTGIKSNWFAFIQKFPVILFLLGYQKVNVLVKQSLTFGFLQVVTDVVVPMNKNKYFMHLLSINGVL